MSVLTFESVAGGFGSLEGPVVGRDGELYVSDLKHGSVLELASSGHVTTVLRREHVGGIAVHRDGGLVLSGESVVHWTRAATRELLRLDDLPPSPSGRAVGFNDLVADPVTGAVIVGVLHHDAEGTPVPGRLVRIDAARSARVVLDGLHPNGLAYSTDGSVLVAADTYGRRLVVLDPMADGSLAVRRSLSTAAVEGLPDGIAMDDDGGVWVAFYRGSCIARFDIDDGAPAIFAFPASKPLSLAFGPSGSRELFVVTGRHPEVGEHSGAVWRAETACTGAPVARATI